MALHQVSDHTFGTLNTYHFVHSNRLDDDDDDYSYDYDDDCESAYSGTTLHVPVDDWKDVTGGKSFAKGPPEQDRFSARPATHLDHQLPTASLHKSHRIATMLYESVSEMLLSSQRDMGILALATVNRNIESLARAESVEARKMKLADLLADGLRVLEKRDTTPSCGSLSRMKQTLHNDQKDQIVDLLSDMFSKIEELNHVVNDDGTDSVAAGESRQCATGWATYEVESESLSSHSCTKRQSSFYSDVSSITSRTTAASLYQGNPSKSRGSMTRLPTALKEASNKDEVKIPRPQSTNDKPNDPSRSACLPSTTKSPTHQRDLDFGITLQDSFSSFCSLDAEDATPKLPRRRGSFFGTKSDSALDVTIAQAATTRQPPVVTRSLDGGSASPRGGADRRPRGRRRADVQAALPRRQQSFDGQN